MMPAPGGQRGALRCRWGDPSLAVRRVGARAAAVGLLLAGVVWTPASTVSAAGATSSGSAEVATPVPVTAPVAPAPASAMEPSAPIDSGEWGPLLDWGIQAKHMVTLSTNKVLVWSTGSNARVWDPATGTFTLAPATFGDLHCAGQSTLADGRVIVVGGVNGPPHDGTNITALFDPVTPDLDAGREHDRLPLVCLEHDAGGRARAGDVRRRSGRDAFAGARDLRPGHGHLDAG